MKHCKQKVLKNTIQKKKRVQTKKRFENISVQTKKFQKYQLKTVQNTQMRSENKSGE